ncbi:hypothetical protein GCM10009584_02180 [Ornithinimicrobium humiphilum]
MDEQRNAAGQRVVLDLGHAQVVAVDSAYHVDEVNRGRDVVVNASYTGVLPARFIAEKAPAGAIGLDCAVGPQGASIAGLWYLEALDLPAATVDVSGVRLGDGVDVWTHGRISFLNQPARDLGVREGQTVEEAARAMLAGRSEHPASASEVTNRRTMLEHPSGRSVVCTDSIAFGLPEDRGATVLVTAGHTGRSAVPYLEKVHPHAYICSDGGMGRERSGVAALPVLDAQGVPGATVDARTARMGDALSSWETGIISAVSDLARAAGVSEGMTCQEAAALLVAWNDDTKEPARD